MKLFTVGPVEMSEAVKACGGSPIPYFRTPEFSDVMKHIETNFKMLAKAPENMPGWLCLPHREPVQWKRLFQIF